MFDSTLSLLKLSQGELSVVNSLEELVKFILANHESLSLQVIQDVTREQKRLVLWIMINQLRNEILDHPDLQTIKQVENVIITQRFYIKPLLPKFVKQLYVKLSKLAKKYGVKLLDKKYTSTSKLPLLYTGRWTQCTEGHYYSIPQHLPEITCGFSTIQGCPRCTGEEEDDIEHMLVNMFR